MDIEARIRHYPVFLDLAGRLCVVVGEGGAAERRALALSECGADVVVVTAHPSQELLQAGMDGRVSIEQRSYVRGDLRDAFLALCSGCPEEIARAVHDEADETGCLLNVSEMPELTNFLVPSAIDRGLLQIAVSTGGAAPEAARRARAAVAEAIGGHWAAYTRLAADVRALAYERVADDEELARVLSALASADIPARLAAGHEPTAEGLLMELRGCAARDDGTAPAGPGDTGSE